MIYDVITYNGEEELFEIRYNILKDVVDEFRVIEFDKTFSGKSKEKLFDQHYDKVRNFFVPESDWGMYKDVALSSPNTEYGKGAEHWVREFCQKESIRDCLVDLQDNDILFIGDCDEVWHPSLAHYSPHTSHKLGLLVYSYYLNNKSSEEFYGTLFTEYGIIKDKCLNHVRSQSNYHELIPNAGWHFTSMGGYERVRQKLTDSYTEDSYAKPVVIDNLESNINSNKDFLGRNFTYTVDTSLWPQYLKDNMDKYKHLLSPTLEGVPQKEPIAHVHCGVGE